MLPFWSDLLPLFRVALATVSAIPSVVRRSSLLPASHRHCSNPYNRATKADRAAATGEQRDGYVIAHCVPA